MRVPFTKVVESFVFILGNLKETPKTLSNFINTPNKVSKRTRFMNGQFAHGKFVVPYMLRHQNSANFSGTSSTKCSNKEPLLLIGKIDCKHQRCYQN